MEDPFWRVGKNRWRVDEIFTVFDSERAPCDKLELLNPFFFCNWDTILDHYIQYTNYIFIISSMTLSKVAVFLALLPKLIHYKRVFFIAFLKNTGQNKGLASRPSATCVSSWRRWKRCLWRWGNGFGGEFI